MVIKRIAVALSGGVDSAVSALILHRKGFRVTGVFMQNWSALDEHGRCNSETEYMEAQKAAEIIGIPIKRLNFEKEYWTSVFSDTLNTYERGITPNPDVMCNRHIKFGALYNHVINELEFDKIATGHYARIKWCNRHGYLLQRGADLLKDQTYFLSQVNPACLERCVFPIGGLQKSEVRYIAEKNRLEHFTMKKESMGICFIGKRKFAEFICEYVDEKPGYMRDVETNRIVKAHRGVHTLTVGQKATRLRDDRESYYICELDSNTNTAYVCRGSNHPALQHTIIYISSIHWLSPLQKQQLEKDRYLVCDMKPRYTTTMCRCTIFVEDEKLWIEPLDPLPGHLVAPGQYAVFYDNDICIGSAVILKDLHRLDTIREAARGSQHTDKLTGDGQWNKKESMSDNEASELIENSCTYRDDVEGKEMVASESVLL